MLAGLLTLAATQSIEAQKTSTSTDLRHTQDTVSQKGEHGVGWVRSNPLDNWYLQTQAGGQLYYGFEDRKGDLGDRLTSNFEVHAGHWVFPMVGYRIGGGMGNARGFITKNSYNTYSAQLGQYSSYHCVNPRTDDPTRYYYGYYYDFDNELYVQEWKYWYGNIDLMMNLTNMKEYHRYNENKKWDNIVYGGVSIYTDEGRVEPNPQVPNESNWAYEGHVGYIGKYQFCKNFNVYCDARFSVMEGLFDAEKLEGIEKSTPDYMLNLHAGMSWDFGFRSESKRIAEYRSKGFSEANLYGPNGHLANFVHYVQIEDVDQIRIIDTIIKYKTVYYDDTVTMRLVDSLQNMLDNRLGVNKDLANDQPLDSIFEHHLLPYEMVFFELDKWDILSREELKIAKMAKVMKAYPNEKFILTGSADSKTGTVKRNIFLSHNRADVVYNKLVQEYGINPNQLEREYLGGILEYKPYQLNRTTVIIMDHPTVRKAFNAMKADGTAGGGTVEFEK